MNRLQARYDVFSGVRGWAPPELLDLLDQITSLLPHELRYRLKRVIDTIPQDGENIYKVLGLIRSQWTQLQSNSLVRVVLVGPARAGKSSLIEAISREQEDPEKQIFSIVDLLAFEDSSEHQSRIVEFEKLRTADVVVFLLDARYELSRTTVQLYERLKSVKRPLLVVLNKMDLVEHPSSTLKNARKTLDTNILGVSAIQPETWNKLLRTIVAANPKTLYALTQNFPNFRRVICNSIVTHAAFSAAVVGAIPIPISDFLPLVAVQTPMILKIAKVFGHPLNRQRALELLPMLASDLLIREGVNRLCKQFPQYRDLITVSVGGLWTFILGRVTIQYFGKISSVAVNKNLRYFPGRIRAEIN